MVTPASGKNRKRDCCRQRHFTGEPPAAGLAERRRGVDRKRELLRRERDGNHGSDETGKV